MTSRTLHCSELITVASSIAYYVVRGVQSLPVGSRPPRYARRGEGALTARDWTWQDLSLSSPATLLFSKTDPSNDDFSVISGRR